MKTLIIVPAYNESKNIVAVITALKKENPKWDIVVVNDGSLDNTGEMAKNTGKAYVINLPCNIGIGGAVQTGFKFAKQYNYDIAIQFDGDGQHIASEINKILEHILKDESDIVIGSRFCKNHSGFKSTWSRRIGIKTFATVNSLLIRQKVTDNTSGFRCFNKAAIDFLAEYYPSDYPEPESVVLLGRNGFRITEVFTEMRERQNGKSSIYGLLSVYYMIKVLLAIIMTEIRPRIRKV
jgi:glycosyltransferase involved in cell wall biosynthesis